MSRRSPKPQTSSSCAAGSPNSPVNRGPRSPSWPLSWPQDWWRFPLTILIAATAAAFGPWLGLAYAAIGALVSALTTYAIGAMIGKDALRGLLGARLDRIRARLARQGVIAIAAIRLVPVAPFTLVNLAAGAAEIRLRDYVIGTLLGLAPGLVVLSALGHQIVEILTKPTVIGSAILLATIVAWIAASIAIQVLVSRRWSSRP